MDDRFTAPLEPDTERAVTMSMYAIGVQLLEIANGTATVDVDLTPFVSQVQQASDQLTFSLAWHLELYGAAQPKSRRPVCAKVNGDIVFIGLIETVNDYRLSTGTRTMSVTVRSRDATPAWREVPRATANYPVGTRLDVIARDVAQALLDPSEVLLPDITVTTSQSSTQFAQVSAWSMLETLLLPAGYTPATDALGRLRVWSRDVTRPSDIVLTEDRLLEVSGGRSQPAVTRLQVLWLDPNLTYVEQQERVVGQANITAGFFQLKQEQDIWFSDDHTQRVKDSRMVIVQSANSGIFRVCSEEYAIVGLVGGEGDLHGKITLRTEVWVPALLAAFIAVKAAGLLPDIAPPFGGPTTPTGKRVHAALEFAVFLVMASIGTGSFEIWGVPFDYAHARNTMEVFDPDADPMSEKLQTIETDLVMNRDHAQAFASREFLFTALGANSFGVTMVDDLRVQIGDILELPDASRLFVTDFQRELSHGAPATLQVSGFQVSGASA
jgi:hypothetical protein